MKICIKCNIEKCLSDFAKRKDVKSGYSTLCIECDRLKNREYSQKFYKENTNKVLDNKKTYRKTEQFKDLDRKRRKTPAAIYRKSLHSIIRRLNSKKEDNTQSILGYTKFEFKAHFESLFRDGMSWENHGEWHIDHITPISAYPIGTDIKEINALSNLQPLWASENLAKSDKILYA